MHIKGAPCAQRLLPSVLNVTVRKDFDGEGFKKQVNMSGIRNTSQS